MALAAVTLHESLRPWRAAGLLHVLLEEPVKESGAAYSFKVPACAPSGSAPASASTGAFSPVRSSTLRQESEGKYSPENGIQKTAVPPQSGRISIRPASPSDPQDWPQPWQAAFAKTRRAPLVWSYHELGLDLLGQGSRDRSLFFRTLIGELGLPGGTSTFWPTAVPGPGEAGGGAALQADASVYQAGLRLLSARAVVLLGVQGLHDAGYDALPLFDQSIDGGRLILHVPDLGVLLADPAQVRVCVSFLQAALGSLV